MACKSCPVTFLIKTLQCLCPGKSLLDTWFIRLLTVDSGRILSVPLRALPWSLPVLFSALLFHMCFSLPRLQAGPPEGVSLPLSASPSCPPSALPSSSAFLGVRLKSSLQRGSLDLLSPSSHSLCISSSVMFIFLAGGLLLQQPVIPGRQAVLVTAVFPAPSVVCHTEGT